MTFRKQNLARFGFAAALFAANCWQAIPNAPRHAPFLAEAQTTDAAERETVVHITEKVAGKITIGTGWTAWCHRGKMGNADSPDYSLTWTDKQWAAYFRLLKRSGADWMGIDLYYGDSEPQSPDAFADHQPRYDFTTPRLRYLYKFLDFAQKNDVHVRLYYTYLLSPHRYKQNPSTGWLSQFARAARFSPDAFTRSANSEEGSGDSPLDKKRLRDNLVATAAYLIQKRHYSCVKQLCLYCEPDVGWSNVDGWEDNRELGRAMEQAGLRGKIQILAPDSYHPCEPKPGDQVDIVACHDYDTRLNFERPEQGLQGGFPFGDFAQRTHQDAQKRHRQAEAALTEYGNWGAGPIQLAAQDAMPSYLGTLSSSCFVFSLYNAGFAGTLRWSFDPVYHPYDGFAAIKTENCAYPKISGPQTNQETFRALTEAWKRGAECVEFAPTFEPQRLINTNLRRGATIYQTTVDDTRGKGLFAIAARDRRGARHIGLINTYAQSVSVRLDFPAGAAIPAKLNWQTYDATLPAQAAQGVALRNGRGEYRITLTPRSLYFSQ